jgi:hypothetical protein
MDYYFVREPTIEWRWQDLVAQMDDESMQHVVEGANRSRGLISCRLERSDVFDHERMSAEIKAGRATTETVQLMYTWDFVAVREDGTEAWMHPNSSNTKVKIAATKGLTIPLQHLYWTTKSPVQDQVGQVDQAPTIT